MKWLANQGIITKCVGYMLLYNPTLLTMQYFVFRAFVESYFNISLALLIYLVSHPLSEQ